MSLRVKYGDSEVPVDWKWPVQIGYIKQLADENIGNELKGFYWLNKLAHVHSMSRVRNRTNILVLKGHLNDIYSTLDKIDYKLHADLLVILLEKDDIIPRYYNKAIERLQNVKCNSFYITAAVEGYREFFLLEELIYQLSHNQPVDAAVRTIDWPGVFVTSHELVSESRLDKVLAKLLAKVEDSTKKKNYDLGKVLTRRVRDGIDHYASLAIDDGDKALEAAPEEEAIIEDIKKKSATFKYIHESDESTIIKDISTNHSANVSDTVERTEEAMAEAVKSGARYLQCLFRDKLNEPLHHALLVDHTYTLAIKIGVPDEHFLMGREVSKDDVEIAEGGKERVDILLRYGEELEQKHIMLPYEGTSNEALFDVMISKEGETLFEIFAFHKNRLFQQLDLSVFFCVEEEEIGDVPGMKIEMINKLRTGLSDFELEQEYGLSVVSTDRYPIMAQNGKITEITYEHAIRQFNKEVKDSIEDYVTSSNPDADNLIFNLALLGSNLFFSLFNDTSIFDYPIQIISSTSDHFPLEFLYTYKIPDEAEILCRHASQALIEGQCRGCNVANPEYICPFGFVSLRTVIERHRVGENVDMIRPGNIGLKTDVSLSRPAIPVLNNTLFGTSQKVDGSVQGLRKQLHETIAKCSPRSKEATSWDQWKTAIKSEQPDSLVIIGHVEPHKRVRINQLEIGQSLIRQTSIYKEHISASNNTAPPFVILIGCNTQNLDRSLLDLSNRFKSCGAAIVLSTFTKIRGSHAVPLVECLIKELSNKKGTMIPFGEAMLELRRKSFANGLYVSMAMVSHGDADWQLKIL